LKIFNVPMTIREILRQTSLRYNLSPLDMGILLSLATNRSKEFIIAHPEKKLTKFQIEKFCSFVKRRSEGEPIAYIVGKKEFFGLDFLTNDKVLIPRPETELLVEVALARMQSNQYEIPNAIIDVGTGSGNIIISIYKRLPKKIKKGIIFFAVDISRDALKTAKKNAKHFRAVRKIKFIQSNLLDFFQKNKIKFENLLIIANLPYLSPALYQRNKKKLKFEPQSALISKGNGLKHYARLLREMSDISRKNPVSRIACLMEMSPEQKTPFVHILKKYLPESKATFSKDLAGKWRIVKIEINPM
jgi:release factor glutamine methyltransferase